MVVLVLQVLCLVEYFFWRRVGFVLLGARLGRGGCATVLKGWGVTVGLVSSSGCMIGVGMGISVVVVQLYWRTGSGVGLVAWLICLICTATSFFYGCFFGHPS